MSFVRGSLIPLLRARKFLLWLAVAALCWGGAVALRHVNNYPISDQEIHFTDSEFPPSPGGGNADVTEKDLINSRYFEIPSSEKTQKFWWNFVLQYRTGNPTRFHFLVDDCLEDIVVNGQRIDLSGYTHEQLCAYNIGNVVDLHDQLVDGPNIVAVRGSDIGGALKVQVSPTAPGGVGTDQLLVALAVIPLILALQLLFLLPSSLQSNISRIGITTLFWLAAALFIFRFLQVSPEEKAHDYLFGGNKEYIEYVAANWVPPKPQQCFLCYHPPLYYYGAAAAHKLGQLTGLAEPMVAAKGFGLLVYSGVLFLSLRLLMLGNVRPRYLLLSFAVIALWPIGFVKSAETNGDMLTALFVLASMLASFAWYRAPTLRLMLLALLIAAVGMYAKSSAIVAFGIFGITFLLAWRNRKFTLRSWLRWDAVLGVLLIGAMAGGYLFYVNQISGNQGHTLIASSQRLNGGLEIQNDSLVDYVIFPLDTYLRIPFLNTWDDASGRRYFWNAFLKTFLFGEWHWKAEHAAIMLNTVFLLLLGVGVHAYTLSMRAVRSHTDEAASLQLPLLAFVGLIASVIALRATAPYSCHQDLRFIYAAMPLLCALLARSMAFLDGSGRIIQLRLLCGLSLCLIALSLALFFGEYGGVLGI